MPVKPLFKAGELKRYLSHSGAGHLFTVDNAMEGAEPAAGDGLRTRASRRPGNDPTHSVRRRSPADAAALSERTVDPADRRAAKLALPRAGQRVVHQVPQRRQEEIIRIVQAMPAERRSATRDSIVHTT